MGRTKKIKGLGDVIEKVTQAVGIEPCENCNDRKEKLNKRFPFGMLELTEEEKEYLKDFFSVEHKELSIEQQNKLTEIYKRVNRLKVFEVCYGCSGTWKTIIKKLKNLHDEN